MYFCSNGGRPDGDLNGLTVFKNCLMCTPMGRAPSVTQVNCLAGEETVGYGTVLAYILCIRDTDQYAKPEVDNPTSSPPSLFCFC